jgi:hypothetical protein
VVVVKDGGWMMLMVWQLCFWHTREGVEMVGFERQWRVEAERGVGRAHPSV